MPSLLDYYRPRPTDPFGSFNSRVTYYAPGPGDRMEGGFETSRPNPQTGKRVPSTLDDVRLGTSPFVTLAGDPSRYGQTVKMGPLTYTSPLDQKSYTIPDVTGYVHDTGSAFKGRPDKLDVAAGDYRGYSPQAASAAVTADAGRRTVTPLEGDEADRAMRPIGMPEPWRATGEGYDQTAVAEGPPPPQQGRKMPNSLMDMFQPQDAAGQPVGFGDAVTGRSNSLIGLGLGLLSPSNPLRGQSGWGQALEGFQAGAALDTRTATSKAALAHQKTQEARQAMMDQFHRQNALATRDLAERQFARSDPANAVSPAQTAMRDVLGPDATPEQKSAFMQDFYKSKTEGNLVAQADQRRAIAQAQGLDPNDPKIKGWIAGGGALNEKPRDLSVTDITKLSEEGSKLSSLGTFHSTFEPRFAGRPFYGEAANLAGRTLPAGVVGKDVADSATWWQGYDQYKNVVRHDLYGGALTPTEVTVFEKANITPGMDPKQIEKNLATQKEVVLNGVRRKANAMIAAGYDPATIANAYGVNLKDIGVTATGRGGSATPAATTATAPATSATTKVEQQKTVNGKSYSKIDGKWYED